MTRLPLALLVLLLAAGPSAAREPLRRTVTIGARQTWATPAYVQDSGAPGPTVVIVAGVHGNEPASTYAADQIRHWRIRRGRLAVVPRANVDALDAFKRRTPGVEKSLGDLNRNFPRAGRNEQPRGRRARALWSFVRSMEPDWVVDLHEGSDFHRVNKKSVGSSVISGKSVEAQTAATFLLDAVNATISKTTQRFVRLGVGTPAIACGTCGEGRVIVFSPHPEQTKGLEWLVERAVRWTAGEDVKMEDAK